MRSISLMILLALVLVSCQNRKVEEQTPKTTSPINIKQVVGIGRIEPENQILQISPEVAGIVEKVYKNENDSVRAGDIIAELKHTVEDANITQLRSAVSVQAAQIKVDENAIKELQIRYANANTELQRLQNLLEKGAETHQVVDDATTEMKSFQANINKLQATVQVSKLKWSEAKTQVGIAEAQLKQKYIRAPVSGVLLEINIQTGNYIDSQQTIAQLRPKGRTIAVCEIDELFAEKIKVGQPAIIRNTGSLDTLSTGKIYFAASFLRKKSLFTDQAGEKEDRRVREIKILLDNPKGILLNSRIECVVFI
ncbi:MAG TPA: HlyD family efflux transporter periplasmic adaptor subunit [Saprospiraceae bacterium]|nr:HlyD family efflux transporter periplasmic adaptor subunit [Saprospiraceae bacterium]HQW55165.1 HlyD family efflux transporter periplasmic adaptor subunit [Saprospiraceae bacterium]